METLTHICAKTEAAFKEFYVGMVIGKLEKVAKEWIDEDYKILNFTIKPGDSLIVIAELSNKNADHFKYSLFRFFPGGQLDGWYISADLNNVSHEKLLEHLMKRYK